MRKLAIALLLNLSIAGGLVEPARAENPATAPAELTEIISGIETAANQQNVEGVIEYYSPEFTNTDGLTVDTVSQALTQMWDSFDRLKYQIELESWSREGDRLVAVTTTTIMGEQNVNERKARLNSRIKSRQYFEGQKLVRQEILTEQSRLSSGTNPPQVEVVAPSTVTAGSKYNFDLIVDEPLDDRVLLGGVKEDKTAGNLYLNPTAVELEPLPAGGIYKQATAPLLPDSNWLSAVLVRGDGITTVVHRVNVEEASDR